MKIPVLIMIIVSLIGTAFPIRAQTIEKGVSQPEHRILTPGDQLQKEHRVIMRVVAAAKKEAATIKKQEHPDTKRIRQMVEFFSNFVHRCHFAKQERFYFPAVMYHGSAAVQAFISELKTEHAYARSIIEELKYVLDYDEENVYFLAERLETYSTLLEKHLENENDQLFPKAGLYIIGAEERAIRVGFEKIEKMDLGPGFHEKYRAIAEDLTNLRDEEE